MGLSTALWRWSAMGLPVNDGLGTVILLEIINAVTVTISVIEIILGIMFDRDKFASSTLEILEVTLMQAKYVTFPCLVLAGFVWLGKPVALKIWVIAGVLMDIALGIILSYYHSRPGVPTQYILIFIACLLGTILYRGYIYLAGYSAWAESSKGIELKGYGQGFGNLFQYYKEEFRRLASIILVVELIWNALAPLARDLEMDLFLLQQRSPDHTGFYFPRMIIVLRVVRWMVAAFGLYFINKEKYPQLKFGWLPSQLLSMLLGIVIFGLVVKDEYILHKDHVSIIGMFTWETIVHLVPGLLLLYGVAKLLRQRPIGPKPLIVEHTT